MSRFENIETNNYDLALERATCTVNLGCQMNLHEIAQRWYNVEYRDEQLIVQLRKPEVTANILSNGEMSCHSALSEEEAHIGARHIAFKLQKEHQDVKLPPKRRVEVRARCTMPFRINLGAFALWNTNTRTKAKTLYEPELSGNVEYDVPDSQAHLSIQETGIIEITVPTMADARKAADHIYPKVKPFRVLPKA